MNKIAIIGYSSHAFGITEIILNSDNNVIVGYFDSEEKKINPFNLKYLGFEDVFNLDSFILNNIYFVVTIGNNHIRKNKINLLESNNVKLFNVISNDSKISKYINIDSGCQILNGVVINPLVRIGKGVIVNSGAVIEHECDLDNFVHIAPGAVLNGNVSVGECSFIGANSVIKQGISIGKNVIVGAGAVVLNHIADNEVWVGNPAKKIRNNE